MIEEFVRAMGYRFKPRGGALLYPHGELNSLWNIQSVLTVSWTLFCTGKDSRCGIKRCNGRHLLLTDVHVSVMLTMYQETEGGMDGRREEGRERERERERGGGGGR